MKFVDKLEAMIAGWLKPVPHLPKAGQKWLGTNVWWIVLIGAALSVITIFTTIGSIFTAMSYQDTVNSVFGAALLGNAYSGMWYVATIVGLIFSALSVLILALAIKPLQVMNGKGWSFLFLAWVVNVVGFVVSLILTFNPLTIIGLIFGAIVMAISVYFIYEIRGEFKAGTTKAKVDAKKVDA